MTAEYILGNDIFEMRRLSAKRFMSVESDALALVEEYSDTHQNKETARWAVIACESLYKNGQKAFSSADEVLENLTFEQLSAFSEAYRCFENSLAGTLILQNKPDTKDIPPRKDEAEHINTYICTLPYMASVFSLEDLSDALQMESLRRFRNIGGELIDR